MANPIAASEDSIFDAIRGDEAAAQLLADVSNATKPVPDADWLFKGLQAALATASDAHLRGWCRRIAKRLESPTR